MCSVLCTCSEQDKGQQFWPVNVEQHTLCRKVSFVMNWWLALCWHTRCRWWQSWWQQPRAVDFPANGSMAHASIRPPISGPHAQISNLCAFVSDAVLLVSAVWYNHCVYSQCIMMYIHYGAFVCHVSSLEATIAPSNYPHIDVGTGTLA